MSKSPPIQKKPKLCPRCGIRLTPAVGSQHARCGCKLPTSRKKTLQTRSKEWLA